MNESNKISEEELFKIFKSLHVSMHMSDLKNPTKEFMISVFETFLRDLQINPGSKLLMPFECICHLENPELYEESQSYILLAATMDHLLRTVCKNPVTVTISDIVAPKPKKTKKILNFVVVLWNYVLQKQELISQVFDTLRPEIQRAEKIKEECLDLDSKYQDLVEKLNNVTTSKEELLKIYAVKDEINKKHERTQKTIVDDYQNLKEKESQLQTEKVNMDLEIATNKERINELDQLILSSPEKIKTDAQKLKDMIKDVEEKISGKEQEKKEKKKENQNKVTSQEELIKSSSKVQKLHSELQLLMENIQTLTMVSEKCQEVSKELKELQSANICKENLANIYEENCARIQQHKKKQMEEMNKTFEMLQRQLSEETQNCNSLVASIAELERNIDKETDAVVSIVECCKNAEAETKQYKSLYKQQILTINNKFKDDCDQISKKQKLIFKSVQ